MFCQKSRQPVNSKTTRKLGMPAVASRDGTTPRSLLPLWNQSWWNHDRSFYGECRILEWCLTFRHPQRYRCEHEKFVRADDIKRSIQNTCEACRSFAHGP